MFVASCVSMFLTYAYGRPMLTSALAAMSPNAAATSLNRVLERLQRHYRETQSFTAKFDENISRPGVPVVKRSGTIYYQKPGKLRWEFDGSQPETIVSDGHIIYDYDPGLNQVVETPLTQAVSSQAAAAFLLGAGDLRRDFVADGIADSNSSGLIRLNLTSKNGGERIEAGIDPKSNNIILLSISDAIGNRTDFKFSSIELNQPIPASLFSFIPPNGADIVSGEQPLK
jgi:outer membrane lipoprotein carrier protein